MLSLNIVSSEIKKEIKLRNAYEIIRNINYFLLIFVVFIVIILLSVKLLLDYSFTKTVNEVTLVTENNRNNNNDAQELNSKFTYIINTQQEFIPWSNLHKEISDITNEGLKYYYIKVNTKDALVEFKGTVDTRNNLLSFKQGLDESAIFNNIHFPIKNILNKENISFDITATVDIDQIKNN